MLKGYANIISHWNENYLAVNIADVRRGEGGLTICGQRGVGVEKLAFCWRPLWMTPFAIAVLSSTLVDCSGDWAQMSRIGQNDTTQLIAVIKSFRRLVSQSQADGRRGLCTLSGRTGATSEHCRRCRLYRRQLSEPAIVHEEGPGALVSSFLILKI